MSCAKSPPLRHTDCYLAAAQAIADGLADLHRQGYAHCDIKPENLVAHRSGGLAFVDLSCGRRQGDPEVIVVTGTTGWMVPERHAGGLTVAQEQRADVFSAGLTLCFLRTGRPLLDDQPDTAQQMINNHLAWDPADLDVLPAAMRPVIARALDYNPGQRPTAEKLRAEIRRAIATQAALRPVWWRTRSATAAAAIIVVLAVSAGIVAGLQPGNLRCPLGTYSPDHGDTVLRIGGLIAYTGPIAGDGGSQSAALRLAVGDIRAVGTSPNYRIEEYQLDREEKDEGDPATDTICGSVDALLRNQTDVIIGPSTSANTLKVLDTVTAAGSLLVAVSTAPELSTHPDGGRFLRTVASDELQARVLSRRVYYWRGLLKDRGVECISGQQHTNDVGTQLLAWGVSTQRSPRAIDLKKVRVSTGSYGNGAYGRTVPCSGAHSSGCEQCAYPVDSEGEQQGR